MFFGCTGTSGAAMSAFGCFRLNLRIVLRTRHTGGHAAALEAVCHDAMIQSCAAERYANDDLRTGDDTWEAATSVLLE